jgi:hypothetical protein
VNDVLWFIAVPSAVIWLSVLAIRPRWLASLSIVLVIVQFNWFNRYYDVPPYFNRLSLVLIGLLGAVLLVHHLAGDSVRLAAPMLRPVMYLGFFFICLTLVSNFYNGEDLILGFFELRYYFAGFVLTYALYTYFGPALDIKLFKKAIVYIALVQLPFTALQFMSAEGGASRTLDSVTGTFSVYTELVACQILAIGLLLTDKLIRNENTIRFNSYLVVFVLLVPLLLSKSKMATAFVVMIIVFCWIYSGISRKNAGVVIQHFYTMGMLVTVAGVLFHSFFWERLNFHKYLEPQAVYEYFTVQPTIDYGEVEWIKARRLGRLSAITESVTHVSKDPVTAVIGYGSGAVSVSAALDREGRLYQEPGFGPLAGINRNQYSKTIMEFGLAGILGFVLFFVALYRKTERMPLRREIRAVLSTIVVCLIPMSFYGLTLGTFYMSFVVAFFVATVQCEADRKWFVARGSRWHAGRRWSKARRATRVRLEPRLASPQTRPPVTS